MKAIVNTTRITPRKANLIAGMIRNKKANEALSILNYTPKKAAKILHKLLASAVANATNNYKQDANTLIVKEIIVNKGPTLKRSVPVSRGRAYPVLKRTSHITLTLAMSATETGKKKTKKSAESETTASSEKSVSEKPAKVKKTTKKSTK